jgi:hypothetical protein
MSVTDLIALFIVFSAEFSILYYINKNNKLFVINLEIFTP